MDSTRCWQSGLRDVNFVLFWFYNCVICMRCWFYWAGNVCQLLDRVRIFAFSKVECYFLMEGLFELDLSLGLMVRWVHPMTADSAILSETLSEHSITLSSSSSVTSPSPASAEFGVTRDKTKSWQTEKTNRANTQEKDARGTRHHFTAGCVEHKPSFTSKDKDLSRPSSKESPPVSRPTGGQQCS